MTMTTATARLNAQISARILRRVQAGMDIRQAFDEVLGQGAYERMAGDLYDAIRAKAAA